MLWITGQSFSYNSKMTLVRANVTVFDPFTGSCVVFPGRIQPVEVTIPSLTDDDDELSATPNGGIDLAMEIDDTFEESSVRKGKRKAVD